MHCVDCQKPVPLDDQRERFVGTDSEGTPIFDVLCIACHRKHIQEVEGRTDG